MARLFVTIWLPGEVVEQLRLVARDSWRDVRWIPERNWHITLRFLGEASVEPVLAAIGAVELPAATAEVALRIARLGDRSLVVPVAGVDALAASVRDATRGLGSDRRVTAGEPFRGHITLGRSQGRRPILGDVHGGDPPPPIRFEVNDVALVASVLTEHGAEYDTVATRPVGRYGR